MSKRGLSNFNTFKMFNRKNGQVANQAFIYIMAGIIFAMVLMFGYNAVRDFSAKSDYVGLIDFKTELESTINGIASTQDRVEKEFLIPGSHKELCMVDMTQGGYQNCRSSGTNCYNYCIGSLKGELPNVVCNAWKDNVSQSIFLLPYADISFKTVRIQLLDEDTGEDKGFLCTDVVRGRVKFQFTGKGNRAQIKPVVD